MTWLISAAVLGFVAPAQAATTYTVNGFGDGTGACSATSSSSFTCPTLRSAANAAAGQSGAVIALAAGIYQLTLGQLPIGATTITGAGPGGPGGTTIMQTDGKDRVIEVQAGPAELSGVEVTGGHLSPSSSPACSSEPWAGGGIVALASLVLQNVLVDGNQVVAPTGPNGAEADCAEGGGIAYTSGGEGEIVDSTISDNSVAGGAGGGAGGSGGQAYGGGIADLDGGSLTVERSTIAQDIASGGSATTTPGNGGSAWGGGIFVEGTSTTTVLQLVNSTVFGNSAAGGPGASGGSPGLGRGGGLSAQGATARVTLQSDTIDTNRADADGDLSVAVGSGAPYPFTIHDTIIAAGLPTDCGITGPPASESFNLEDDSAGQCDFNSANHDLVGEAPQLAPALANNGGPTETLAPATTSPILGAGGTPAQGSACLDPTSSPPNQPLSVDQRGEPRLTAATGPGATSTPCDIGAFQAQRPQATLIPAISGLAVRGQTLICSQGSWTGDGTLTFSFAWLRNGIPIPGQTTNTYVVRPKDAGQTLACRVTASYYGSTSAASGFAVVPSLPVITLLGVSASPGLVAVSLGCRGPDLERCTGVVRVTVLQKLHGSTRSRTVTLAHKRYSMLARHVATIRIVLSSSAARLLRRGAKLSLKLTVSQTTVLGTTTVASRALPLRAPRVRRRRRG